VSRRDGFRVDVDETTDRVSAVSRDARVDSLGRRRTWAFLSLSMDEAPSPLPVNLLHMVRDRWGGRGCGMARWPACAAMGANNMRV
jgi:hypothetical protein